MTQTKIKNQRPTYATVHLDRFAANIETARSCAGVDIIAIIKANGYGHGARALARHAVDVCGVSRFGVATAAEAIELVDEVGDEATIYALGFVDPVFYGDVVAAGVVLPMYDDDVAASYHAFLEEIDASAPVTIKIDSGMHRLGFSPDLDLDAFSTKYPRFTVVHVMSHLASADADAAYTTAQIETFAAWIEKNEPDAATSMFNSSGIVGYDNTFTLARPGIMLYGYVDTDTPNPPELKPVMKITSRVVHVLHLKKGESVSYGRRFTAEKDMTVGVVPMGYADGYPRSFTNTAHMMIDDVTCPVVGTVCMDMTMIDLSSVPESRYNADVEVLGDRVTADMWASWANTISYEVLCGISARIPRIYRTDGGA